MTGRSGSSSACELEESLRSLPMTLASQRVRAAARGRVLRVTFAAGAGGQPGAHGDPPLSAVLRRAGRGAHWRREPVGVCGAPGWLPATGGAAWVGAGTAPPLGTMPGGPWRTSPVVPPPERLLCAVAQVGAARRTAMAQVGACGAPPGRDRVGTRLLIRAPVQVQLADVSQRGLGLTPGVWSSLEVSGMVAVKPPGQVPPCRIGARAEGKVRCA